MLQDCVYGAAGTIFQRLYVQCRIVGLPRLLAHDDSRPWAIAGIEQAQ